MLSGVALAAATSTFDIVAADSSAPTRQTSRATFTLTARPQPATPLLFVTSRLADAVAGVSYSQTLVATGGVPPYLFTLQRGSIPFGLSLDGLRGVLSGSPSQVATTELDVLVIDSASQGANRAERVFQFQVVSQALPLTVTTTGLPAGSLDRIYSADVAVAGGTPPFSFFVSSGQLPLGLALDSKLGIVSGTPREQVRAALSIAVRDSTPGAVRTATRQFTLSIGPAPLTLLTTELPDAFAGNSYLGLLSASGGTPPYRYSLTQGALPAGFRLDASGQLLGMGTEASVSNVTLRVSDSAPADAQERSRTFEFRVLEPFELSVPPRGGLLAFSLGPRLTPALLNLQQFAEAAGASQIVFSGAGEQGRGEYQSYVKGLGRSPPPLRGGRGYLVLRHERPAARLALRGVPWPASDYILDLPAGVAIVAVPGSVVATNTTDDLLAITHSAFLVTTEQTPVSKLSALRVFLPGMPAARLDSGLGYMLSLPRARRVDLLRFIGTTP